MNPPIASGARARCLVRGSINIDDFFTVDDIVRPGQTISSSSFTRRAGGKGANQAVAVSRAGGKALLSGSVGLDGAWLVQSLKEAGVDIGQVIEVAEEATGRAIIQVSTSGENSIVLHKGANFAFLPPPSPYTFSSQGITHLLLQNEIPLPSTLSHLSIAHATGVTTLFNPSPMLSVPESLAFPWSEVDWLIVNESEAHHLLSALGTPTSGLTTSALPTDALTRMPIAHVSAVHPPSVIGAYSIVARLHAHSGFSETTNIVCTLGSAGVLAFVPSISETLYMPAAELRGDVRDTTGAGDCFTGYLVAGLLKLRNEGKAILDASNLREILGQCVKAAGMCVEKRGAMESIPALAEVEVR